MHTELNYIDTEFVIKYLCDNHQTNDWHSFIFIFIFNTKKKRLHKNNLLLGGGGGGMTIFHHNTIAQILFHLQFISLEREREREREREGCLFLTLSCINFDQ